MPPSLNVSAALAGERVTVSPGPDTRDASANTQISLLGGGRDAGEARGRHRHAARARARTAGRLLAYSQGDGASFVPARPFADGELVSVHAELAKPGTTIPFAWSFTVAVRDDPGSSSARSWARPRTTAARAPAPKEYQSFHSRPELRPPDVTVSSRTAQRPATCSSPRTPASASTGR